MQPNALHFTKTAQARAICLAVENTQGLVVSRRTNDQKLNLACSSITRPARPVDAVPKRRFGIGTSLEFFP